MYKGWAKQEHFAKPACNPAAVVKSRTLSASAVDSVRSRHLLSTLVGFRRLSPPFVRSRRI